MACFRKRVKFGLAALFLLIPMILPSEANAWEKHRLLMPPILETLPSKTKAELAERVKPPCKEDDLQLYRTLARELELLPSHAIPPTSPGGCQGSYKLSGYELLGGNAIDEPDGSFDVELPESYDPDQERKWMGGLKGITSQGFRHMYFGGWKWLHPIATLQVPPGAMGKAPERAQAIGERARREIRTGSKLWGIRLLGWSMHYVQDLTQPFHSTQIPNVRMVPWSQLFAHFVPETTRTISNYHWAYEGFVLHELSKGAENRFAECLSKPAGFATIPTSPTAYQTDLPRDLALTVAQASRDLASDVGSALISYFGTDLKKPTYDLAHTDNPLDYAAMDRKPELKEARDALIAATCPTLANASVASGLLIQWALAPAGQTQ